MRKLALTNAVVVMTTALLLSTALADEWTAARLRGGVFALENGAWVQLKRGSVISDDRVIKSAPGGRITLVRGAETIELGPDTTAQISDRSGFTTVYNHEGTVGVDAEARNVQHFSVQTPYLAAIVKGTAFTVQSSDAASTVTVTRGSVQVDDEQNGSTVDVLAGQQVTSSPEAPITPISVVAAPPTAPKPPGSQGQFVPVAQTNVGFSDDAGDDGDNEGVSDGGIIDEPVDPVDPIDPVHPVDPNDPDDDSGEDDGDDSGEDDGDDSGDDDGDDGGEDDGDDSGDDDGDDDGNDDDDDGDDDGDDGNDDDDDGDDDGDDGDDDDDDGDDNGDDGDDDDDDGDDDDRDDD